jgi:hypothetical protein
MGDRLRRNAPLLRVPERAAQEQQHKARVHAAEGARQAVAAAEHAEPRAVKQHIRDAGGRSALCALCDGAQRPEHVEPCAKV